ncbi:MAG: DUF2786 domain-containing protein [Desulfobulbaceae bacterium]|nr:DUF2786 domain-containing protein [Desulfobulbaceae bacterium]
MDIEKYRKIWINQLIVEYEEICWGYGVELIPPVFEISDSRKEVGSYHSETRTIRLSRYLLAENSWMVTLQVLKHEMAHQLCSELFGSQDGGHGVEFQRGCELLGVEPEYRLAKSSLPEFEKKLTKGRGVSEKGRRFIDRVEKLFALARSPNENEATLAMQKANELIEKYNLTIFEDGVKRDFGYTVINRKRKRIETYQRHICRILQDFFFVKVIVSSLYDPRIDQSHKIIEILGAKENVAIGEYCYFFLENKLFTLWAYNRQKFRGSTRTEKNSYFLGLLAGFYDKLKKQGEKTTGKAVPARGKAVVLLSARKELEGYVNNRYPRLQKNSRRSVRIYKSTYSDGVATGRTITLTKGVAGAPVQSGRMLTTF